jgi:cytochrome P450
MTTLTATPPAALKRPPTARMHPLLGVMEEFRRDAIGLFDRLGREYGDVVHIRFGPNPGYVVYHPDAVKHVLQDNNRNYIKQPFGMEILKLFAQENVFTGEGDFWRGQRRLMQPAFHRQRLAHFGEIMTRCATEMLDRRWAAAAGSGAPIDVAEEMMRVTLQVVGLALFSVDLSGEASELGHAFDAGDDYIAYRFRSVFAPPPFFPTRQNRAVRAAIRTVRGRILAMIRDRRASGERKHDLLDMLMESRYEETGRGMEEEQIRREAQVMVAAGHETTATALTWVFYLLAQHPAVEGNLHAELGRVLDGRTPAMADLPNLPYTRMVIDEAMRLYPPAAITGRHTLAADELSGFAIPARRDVFIPIHAIHRDPRWWPEPEAFMPERFAAESDRPRFAYLPFGGGPRQCIGNIFAQIEAQLILATVAQRFSLRLAPGQRVEPELKLVLEPKGGLPMTVTPRQ